MRLVWSDPAVSDLESIRDYIAHDSEVYAAKFIAGIIHAAERLENFPELGRRVPEAPDAPDVREILYRSYRILYRLEPERILILGILHGNRELSSTQPQPWSIA